MENTWRFCRKLVSSICRGPQGTEFDQVTETMVVVYHDLDELHLVSSLFSRSCRIGDMGCIEKLESQGSDCCCNDNG